MKKPYEDPDMEVVFFDSDDIICVTTTIDPGGDGGDNEGGNDGRD